jgi:hypothetical protein
MDNGEKESTGQEPARPRPRVQTAEDEERLRRELDADVRWDVLKGKLLLAAIVIAIIVGLTGTMAYLASKSHRPGNVGTGYE